MALKISIPVPSVFHSISESVLFDPVPPEMRSRPIKAFTSSRVVSFMWAGPWRWPGISWILWFVKVTIFAVSLDGTKRLKCSRGVVADLDKLVGPGVSVPLL